METVKKTFIYRLIVLGLSLVLSVIAIASDFSTTKKLAQQGNADAQLNLAGMYNYGEGVQQDYAKAIHWYLKAANQGNADAQFALGVTYFLGDGVRQDSSKAIYWFLKAANQGHSNAQNLLGMMYSRKGVHQDYAKAIHWYQKAANQGNTYAQFNLCMMYADGKGGRQSKIQAKKWYSEKNGCNSYHILNQK